MPSPKGKGLPVYRPLLQDSFTHSTLGENKKTDDEGSIATHASQAKVSSLWIWVLRRKWRLLVGLMGLLTLRYIVQHIRTESNRQHEMSPVVSVQKHSPLMIPGIHGHNNYLQAPLEAWSDNTKSFHDLNFTGFVNTGKPGGLQCDDIRRGGSLKVNTDIILDDDLIEVAEELKSHPLVNYTGEDPALSHKELIKATWHRLLGSSIWLPEYEVFFVVTRVIFFRFGQSWNPVSSWLRGSIYDKDWKERKNYTLHWHGEKITFPRILDVDFDYDTGGTLFGPEDPRIVLEESVSNAEPVIIFNMVSTKSNWERRMWAYRPFSNVTTLFNLRNLDIDERRMEKNWAPFFYRPSTSGVVPAAESYPSLYIHFVYNFYPLAILKCHVYNGWCDLLFQQEEMPSFRQENDEIQGSMRGGTNFVPISLDAAPGVQVYAGFPRTHVDSGCSMPVYRPELVVMVAVGDHFHLAYSSGPLDLMPLDVPYIPVDGSAIPHVPCLGNRMLIPDSIARWEFPGASKHPASSDMLTLAFSVQDVTVQMARISGLGAIISSLPLGEALKHDFSNGEKNSWQMRWSTVAQDVLECSVIEAQDHGLWMAKQGPQPA